MEDFGLHIPCLLVAGKRSDFSFTRMRHPKHVQILKTQTKKYGEISHFYCNISSCWVIFTNLLGGHSIVA